VRGIRLAGETPQAGGRTYFLSHPQPCSLDAVMREIASAFGRRTFSLPVSQLLMSAGAEVSQFIAQFGEGSAKLSHLKVAELAQKYWVVKTGRAKEELGFEAATPISEGLKHTAGWYADNGWL
jgi:nucleoside-diphosphate-sugar epimerase